MAREVTLQEFQVYSNPDPAALASVLQADITAKSPPSYIKQMGVLQFGARVVVWALWERKVYE